MLHGRAAQRAKPTDLTGPRAHAILDIERHLSAEDAPPPLRHPWPILRHHEAHETLGGRTELGRVHAKELVDLLGPVQGARRDVELPAAHTRDHLRLVEQHRFASPLRLAAPKRFLRTPALSALHGFPQLALDHGHEARQIVLAEVVAGARAHHVHGLPLSDGAGHHHEGQVQTRGLQHVEGSSPREGGEREVAQHDVEGVLGERRLELGLAGHAPGAELEAVAPQVAEQQLGVIEVVLDEEHGERAVDQRFPLEECDPHESLSDRVA